MFRTSHAAKRLVSYSAFSLLIISLVFTSCRKEDDPEIPNDPAPQSTAYSFPLTDGSYWIYQHEQTDPNGLVTDVGRTDSVYVEGDTVVGANTYKKIRTVPGSGNQFFLPVESLKLVRDSAGYIVGLHGGFIEHTNFTDTLNYIDYSGMINAWYFMRHEDSVVTVPAGTFQTIDYEGHMHYVFPNPNIPALRYTHDVFADGIGMIVETTFYSNSVNYYQRRLIRYHIQ